MPSGSSPSMKRVYGQAFLIHLNRGDVEMARVFARAFLMAKNGENGPEDNPVSGYL